MDKVGSIQVWDTAAFIKEELKLKRKNSYKTAVECAGSAWVAEGKDDKCRLKGLCSGKQNSRVLYLDHTGSEIYF